MQEYKDVTFSLIEVNTAIDSNSSERGMLKFLSDPNQYNSFYLKKKNILNMGCFKFGTLPRVFSPSNKFWKKYYQADKMDLPFFWERQIPFEGVLRKDFIKLNLESPQSLGKSNQKSLENSIKKELKIRIYLSPLGWCTHVIINLRGDLRKDMIVDTMTKLRRRQDPDKTEMNLPFKIDDKKVEAISRFFDIRTYLRGRRFLSLTDVFNLIKRLIDENVYKNERNDPGIIISDFSPRHYLVSINKASGNSRRYNELPKPYKNYFKKFLFGSELAYPDKKLEATSYGWNSFDFIVTDYNCNTFLFEQRKAFQKIFSTKLICKLKNLQDFITIVCSMSQYYKQAEAFPECNSVKLLRANAAKNLKLLQNRFNFDSIKMSFFESNEVLKQCISEDV